VSQYIIVISTVTKQTNKQIPLHDMSNIFDVAKSLTTRQVFETIHWMCTLVKHPVPNNDTVTIRQFLLNDCNDGTLFIKVLSKVKGTFITHNRAPKGDGYQIQENLKTFINTMSQLVPESQLVNQKSYTFNDGKDDNSNTQWVTLGKLYDLLYNQDDSMIIRLTRMIFASFVLQSEVIASKKIFKGPYLTLTPNTSSPILNVDVPLKDVGTDMEKKVVESPVVTPVASPATPSTPTATKLRSGAIIAKQPNISIDIVEKNKLMSQLKQEIEIEREKRMKELESSMQLMEQKHQRKIEEKLEKKYKQQYEQKIEGLEREIETLKFQQGSTRSGSNLDQVKKLLSAIEKLNTQMTIKDEQIKTLTEQLQFVQEKYDKLKEQDRELEEQQLEPQELDEEKLDSDDEFNVEQPAKVSKLDDLLDQISDEESEEEEELEELEEQEPEELELCEAVVVSKGRTSSGPIQLEELTFDEDDDEELFEVSVFKKK
jgi:hypothetical protein